jgi:hypothetical protein
MVHAAHDLFNRSSSFEPLGPFDICRGLELLQFHDRWEQLEGFSPRLLVTK